MYPLIEKKHIENFSEWTSRQESAIKERKKKNSHFSDIFFYHTEYKITKRKKKIFTDFMIFPKRIFKFHMLHAYVSYTRKKSCDFYWLSTPVACHR